MRKIIGRLLSLLATIGLIVGTASSASAEPVVISVPEVAANNNTIRYQGRTLDASSENSIKLTLIAGDSVQIHTNSFAIVDMHDQTIIALSTDLPTSTKILYDEASGYITLVSTSRTNLLKACVSKNWIKWVIRTFGGVFVCTPAGLAAMGLGGPVAAAFIATGCAGGVDGLIS